MCHDMVYIYICCLLTGRLVLENIFPKSQKYCKGESREVDVICFLREAKSNSLKNRVLPTGFETSECALFSAKCQRQVPARDSGTEFPAL